MNDLRAITLATSDEIKKFPWFSKVGHRHPEVSTATVLDNWYEAVSSVESEDWEGLCLDAANGYREQLLRVAPAPYRKWNEKAEAIKEITVPYINALFSGHASLRELPKVVQDTVQWDMLHVCMEAEFSEYLPPGFYASNSFWYSAGHFPCGWRGKFPDGGPVIY